MNALQQLICKMKIAQNDLSTLHHNMTGGGPAWLALHDQIAGYYDRMDEMTDDIVEIGISMNIQEPGIDIAVNTYKPLPCDPRGIDETIKVTQKVLTEVSDIMQTIGNQMDGEERYIQSRLDDYIYELRKEADYKLDMAIQ